MAGRSGIRPITAFDPSRVASRIAGEVPDFDPSPVLDRKEQRRNDRYTQLALVATREALADAGLPERLDGVARRADRDHPRDRDRRRPHVRRAGRGLRREGPRPDQPVLHPDGDPEPRGRPGRHRLRRPGPQLRGLVRLRHGRPRPRRGVGDDPPRRRRRDDRRARPRPASTRSSSGGFAAMRALSTRNDDPAAASRPFDRGRDGFVIGEGAGVVILEALEHARARGAEPLAELVGYGASADAHHITLPAPGGVGAARAVRRALEKARPLRGRRGARERPRHLHARGRPDRAGDAPGALRRPGRRGQRHGQQEHAGPHPGRGRARSRRRSRS